MEALAAFSVVCNVIQVVDFGLKFLSTCQDVAHKGTTSVNLDVEYTSVHLRDLSERLSSSITQASVAPNTLLTKSDEQIHEVAKKCEACAKELLQQLVKLKSNAQKSKLNAISKTIELIWKRGKLSDIQNRLEGLRRTLDTRILARLYHAQNLNALQQREDFYQLDQKSRDIFNKLVSGHKTVVSLVTREHNKTRAQVQAEGSLIGSKVQAEHVLTRQKITEMAEDSRERHIMIQNEAKQERVLDQAMMYLGSQTLSVRQRMIADLPAHKSTFEWILQSDRDDNDTGAAKAGADFVDWLITGSKFYWISGKAGSGKSTLMHLIALHSRTKDLLSAWAGTAKLLQPVHFFWNSGSLEQRDLSGFLRSLICQSLRSHSELLEPLLHSFFHECDISRIATYGADKLKEIFIGLVSQDICPCRCCIFVDGLDEVGGPYNYLLRLLEDLNATDNVKMCVSSRPLYDFERAFSSCSALKLEDLTQRDMEIFIEERFLTLSNAPNFTERVTSEMKKDLVWKAQGVFLWLVFALKELDEGIEYQDSPGQMRARLEELPEDLNKMYALIVSRIPKVYRSQCAQYLHHMLLSADVSGEMTIGRLALINDDRNFLQSFPKGAVPSLVDWFNSEFLRIAKRCEDTRIQLQTRCRGLLSFTDCSTAWYAYSDTPVFWKHNANNSIMQWATARVSFLHRTLRDFLRDTETGAKLLLLCPIGRDLVIEQQTNALLTEVTILTLWTLSNQNHEALFRTFKFGRSLEPEYEERMRRLDTMIDLLTAAENLSPDVADRIFRHVDTGIDSIIKTAGLSPFRYYDPYSQHNVTSTPLSRPPQKDIIGHAAWRSLHHDFIRTRLARTEASKKSEIATYLLGCITHGLFSHDDFAFLNGRFSYPDHGLTFIEYLLAEGADPNAPVLLVPEHDSSQISGWHYFLFTLCQIPYFLPWRPPPSNARCLIKTFLDTGANVNSEFVVKISHNCSCGPEQYVPFFKPQDVYPSMPLEYIEARFLMTPLGILNFCLGSTKWYGPLECVLLAAGARCSLELASGVVSFMESGRQVQIHEDDQSTFINLWSHAYHERRSFQRHNAIEECADSVDFSDADTDGYADGYADRDADGVGKTILRMEEILDRSKVI